MVARRTVLKASLACCGLAAFAAPAAQAGQAAASAPAALVEAAGGGYPRRLRDAVGRSVVLEQAPQRIVVIFPSNTEIAFALGLGERIVAVGGRVQWPPEAQAKPSVGGALGYSAEAVAALRPDLIVLTPSHRTALSLIDPFERLGVPLLVLHHPDQPAILRNIALLGEATGREAAAAAIVDGMRAQLEAVRGRLRGAPPRRVYLETAAAARGAFQTVGTGHYASDALAWAGGENVFADLSGAAQVSGEAIFARDPDVIVSLQKVPRGVEAIAARPGWAALRAVREGRVVVLERRHFLIPGPRQIEAVQAYARAIHPERYDA